MEKIALKYPNPYQHPNTNLNHHSSLRVSQLPSSTPHSTLRSFTTASLSRCIYRCNFLHGLVIKTLSFLSSHLMASIPSSSDFKIYNPNFFESFFLFHIISHSYSINQHSHYSLHPHFAKSPSLHHLHPLPTPVFLCCGSSGKGLHMRHPFHSSHLSTARHPSFDSKGLFPRSSLSSIKDNITIFVFRFRFQPINHTVF